MFSDRTRWDLSPNEFSRVLDRKRRAGQLLDLTASNPTTAGLRYEREAILSSLQKSESLVYETDPRGLLVARTAVCEYYRGRIPSTDVDPDSLILTSSTSEAYSYLFRLLCNPGDEVLVGAPSYPLFEHLAQIQDVELRSFELVYDHGWLIDFKSLTSKLSPRTRAIILVNPNNPTGSFITEAERQQLNGLARERELALVVDEVFLDFSLDGRTHRSFTENNHALTFTLSGISKICGLPQMKLAWLAVSGPEVQKTEALARLEMIADAYLSPSAPVQNALTGLLCSRQGIQQQIMDRARANLAELDQQLESQHLCTRLQVEGGWYVVLRVPATRTDEELTVELLEHHSVVVHPGHFFDFPSEGFLVLSLITPEREFREGVRRLLGSFG